MGAALCATTEVMEPRSERRMSQVQTQVRMDSWMSHMPPALQDIPLNLLAIPGSHNAITYNLDKQGKSAVDPSQPDLLKKADKYTSGLIRPLMHKWCETQNLTVTQQLNSGIRYCDLRIAHRPKDKSSNLYFYHGLYSKNTVEAVLLEIRKWLDNHPNEVVILSFSHFLDIDNNRHIRLVNTIRKIFSGKLCPRTEMPTLRKMWRSGLQVIVSYEESTIVTHNADFWPHIPYWWANKVKARDLIKSLEKHKSGGRPRGFFVAGINLTVDLPYITKHLHKSLKDLVKASNPAVLAWLKQQRPGNHPRGINIVAADFVGDGHFAQTVVLLNRKLLN
ncbi:PI-PLC X domain-containing protein 1 isoform X1 [Syngnathus scovelli]|uniref:PI-PLC X domain-containing protein 1 isoform X1 n=1 Tax=Syngnathus scovelli TaxID=161590 RepID=UPI002110B3F3|nr:PI-PLC X domain-containing protein 1 isoform X1 [Syngnathus scovelli]XP_049575169.1 PI-PLC X domain-containing protein 1 isoform X1 [Syngnathus scovelli]